MFCNGLRPQAKMLLDALIGGPMLTKNVDEAIEIIESTTASSYQAHHDRSP